jgi:hypothetical protein
MADDVDRRIRVAIADDQVLIRSAQRSSNRCARIGSRSC